MKIPLTAKNLRLPIVALAALLSFVSGGRSAAADCGIQFSDVAPSDEFYNSIHCVACDGFMSGYDDGTFRPYNNVTRAQGAKIMALIGGYTDSVSGQTYADVTSSSTYYTYIEQLTAHGIALGYTCGGSYEPCDAQNRPYFRPSTTISRGGFAKWLAGVKNYTDNISGQTYADVAPDNPFYLAIERLTLHGAVSGYTCGGSGEPCDSQTRPYFRPFNSITRAQVAKEGAIAAGNCSVGSGSAITVPGFADPYLAGMPDGTSVKSDTAPAQSPVLVTLNSFAPGDALTFTATGQTDYSGSSTDPSLDAADGNGGFYPETADDAISGCVYPLNSLVGVFLDDQTPTPVSPDPRATPTPPPSLDFSANNSFGPDYVAVPGGINYTQIKPLLRQLFFIGNGKTNTGTPQQVVVPAGATRLFLGSTDGFGWYNNSGEFKVSVALATASSGGADLKITATASPDPVNIDDTVAYHCVATNVGSVTSQQVHGYLGPDNSAGSTDKYESFKSSDPASNFTDSTGFKYFPLPDLAPGSSASFDVLYTVTAVGQPSRLVGVYGGTADPDLSNNSTTITHGIAAGPSKPALGATHLSINGADYPSIPPDSLIQFKAIQNSSARGLYVRVQASSTPDDEGSWTDLNDGNAGHMVRSFDEDLRQYVWSLNTTTYPLAQNVHFRAIAAADGYTDSISNYIGYFDLRSATPHFAPTVFTMQGSKTEFNVGPADQLHFEAVQTTLPSGVGLRVQYSFRPFDEGSWTDLEDGHAGNMTQATDPTHWFLDTNQYPAGGAVFFRVIASASGYVDSLSNEIGSFALVRDLPPVVTLHAPAGQQGSGSGADADHPLLITQGSFSFSADATGSFDISRIALTFDGSTITSAPGSSTSIQYTTSRSGVHELNAFATDVLGAFGHAVPVYVKFVPPAARNFKMVKSGEWTDASNWTDADGKNGVPSSADLADIGSFTASIAAGEQITVASVIAGNLTGPGSLTITNQFTWNKGTLQSLTLIIPPGARGYVSGPDKKKLKGTTVRNGGYTTIAVADPSTVGADLTSQFRNSGVFDIEGVEPKFFGLALTLGAFVNEGDGLCLLNGIKLDVTGSSSIAIDSKFKAATVAGSFQQLGGTVDLGPAGGTGGIVGNLTMDGGTLIGSGTIVGDLTNNAGYLSPGHSVGDIEVTGNYTQGAKGSLIVEVSAPSAGSDRLEIDGSASLAGTLDVRPIDGASPQKTDAFVPISYSAVSGAFDKVSSNATLTFNSTGAILTVDPAIAAPKAGQPQNIATRLQIQGGDQGLIGGFIVTGPAGSSKKVLIRGIGPSLAKYGVPGTLPDPLLELRDGGGALVTANDNWQSGDTSLIPAGFAPSDPRESVIAATLTVGPSGIGAYTAIIKGAHGELGVGLAEIYDLDPTGPAQLANIATRGFVQTGDNVMIGGFIIGGTEPAKVLVRVTGPTLLQYGISAALNDPTLELHDANGSVIGNDDWRETQEAEIIGTTLQPADDHEPAIFLTLVPGSYTAVVRGKNDTTGVAVVEAYTVK